MNGLKNIPQTPASLSSLIDIRPGQIISMSLSRAETVSMALFGVSEGESISEEAYGQDTMYYILEGTMPIRIGQEHHLVHTGDCIAVPAGTLHAIGGESAFKMLQITL